MDFSDANHNPFENKLSLHKRLTVIFHFLFKALAFVIYILPDSISPPYVTKFVIVLVISSIDFWVVKNVTGRFMVGMRWWNFVDEQGNSKWIFENRKYQRSFVEPPTAFINTLFWTGVWGFAAIWAIMSILNLLTIKWVWLTLTLICATLCGANTIGYFYCSRDTSARENMAQTILGNAVFNSMKSKFIGSNN